VELVITAAAGFLVAVLWFDLMFDVQVLRHRSEPLVPETVLASIAAYYRRVTTTASPMGRLVAMVMLALFVGLLVQAVKGDAAWWVSAVSMPAAILAVGLAVGRVFGRARRLGTRTEPADVQSDLARSICRDHIVCLKVHVCCWWSRRGGIVPGVRSSNRASMTSVWESRLENCVVLDLPRMRSSRERTMRSWRRGQPAPSGWEEAVDQDS
jgi:hypothetical protein